MRYIGGKSGLIDNIHSAVSATELSSVIDIFSGSSVVSASFKAANYDVIGNDLMYFAYVLGRGLISLKEKPKFSKLAKLKIKDPIKFLNHLELKNTDFSQDDCFIYQNYSPNEKSSRMYFQSENAIKIDIIRLTIESWRNSSAINDDEYFYLLAVLISAVPYVSNIAGGNVSFYNQSCNDLLERSEICADLLYADPPYNARQYLPNYHILETIAKYDYPAISGTTGMRNYKDQKSDFCIKNHVESAFDQLFQKASVRYILVSYNNEGLLAAQKLSEICQDHAKSGTFSLFEKEHRPYKNAQTSARSVKEQLYFFEKRQ